MKPQPLPAVDVLRKTLRYEADSGKLFWLPREKNPHLTLVSLVVKRLPVFRLMDTYAEEYSGIRD